MSSDSQHAASLEVLLAIARDLTASLAATDRYARLIAAVRRLIPCDAACLLRLHGDDLVPLAGYGLTAAALARRYPRRDHPRLDVPRSTDLVRFPTDSALPDPFDGVIEAAPGPLHKVHACLGCALTDGGEVVGALTADALEGHAFDALDPRMLATLGALAGAALRTTSLIETLERRADHQNRVACELLRSAIESSGGAILGASDAVARLRREMALAAASDLAVLITGETGVGKELVAHHVHAASARADEALIHVNCAALPLSIAESELFGHVAGSFTGALRDRAGSSRPRRGTLFLDGSASCRSRCSRSCCGSSSTARFSGWDRTRRTASMSASSRRPTATCSAKWRRAVPRRPLPPPRRLPVHVPPLRSRRDDIPVLAAHFATRRRGGWASPGRGSRPPPAITCWRRTGPATSASSRTSSGAACCGRRSGRIGPG